MKRLAFFLLLCASPAAPFAAEPAPDFLKQAQVAANERRFDDAVRLSERALIEGTPDPFRWFPAQYTIARALARKGDFPEAAKAAHLCLDGAPNLVTYTEAVALTASIFSAWDQNVERANQFLQFQQTGPGTDTKNPMDAIGYPLLPEREAAFAELRKNAGELASAARLRAFTLLYTGKPREALAQFADGLRRSASTQDIQRVATELVTVGLRAAHGHTMGLQDAMTFVLCGPNGPDRKPKTPDDLADPFTEAGPVPPPGTGGLAAISEADLAALRKVRDAAELYVADDAVPRDARAAALGALQRTNEALDNWGATGQKDEYLRIEYAVEFDPAILVSLQAAARGRDLHLGNVAALWNEIQAHYDAQRIPASRGLEFYRSAFNNLCTALKNIRIPAPPAPLKRPATF